MNIIKRTKNDSYAVICNTALRDPNLSLQAKGLFAYIMTLPDDWKIHTSEVQKHSTNGKDSHSTAFKELAKYGYLNKKQIRDENGRMNGTEYTLIEKPEEIEKTCGLTVSGKPASGKPVCGKPAPTNYLPLVSTDNNNPPYNPPVGDVTEEIFSLKPNNTSVDYKLACMDNIISDAKKSITSKHNKEFKNLLPSVQRFISEVVSFLNKKQNTKFRSENKITIACILNRIIEGYTLSDFKKVISNQSIIWKDDKKMQQYLRPSTLFGNKFENYLNTKIKQAEKLPAANRDRVGAIRNEGHTSVIRGGGRRRHSEPFYE